MSILNQIPPLDRFHHTVFSFPAPTPNYSEQYESWNILLMGFTAPMIPLSPDLRWFFQLRSYHCWDRQGKSHIWATELCHTCKWGADCAEHNPQSERWRCGCWLPVGHNAWGNLTQPKLLSREDGWRDALWNGPGSFQSAPWWTSWNTFSPGPPILFRLCERSRSGGMSLDEVSINHQRV